MSFTSEEVELLLQVARDAMLGGDFLARMEAVTESLSALVPNTAFSAIVLDLERRRETPRGQIYYKNGRLENLVIYTSHFVHHDPMLPAIPLADGRAHLLSDFVADDHFGRDAFTADYLKLLNVRHVMGSSLHMPNGQLLSLAVHRDRGLPDFTQKEREVLRLASPDITRAAFGSLLREDIARLSPTTSGGRSGAVIFNPQGQMTYGDETGVALTDAYARTLRKGEAQLARMITHFAGTPGAEGDVREDHVELDGRGWFNVRFARLRNGPSSTVLVLFEGLPPGSDEFMVCLMTQAALSPREREVAMLVARGFSNREVAARLSISPATVNVHLMKAFGKLDVPDRHGLTSLLLTGARKG